MDMNGLTEVIFWRAIQRSAGVHSLDILIASAGAGAV